MQDSAHWPYCHLSVVLGEFDCTLLCLIPSVFAQFFVPLQYCVSFLAPSPELKSLTLKPKSRINVAAANLPVITVCTARGKPTYLPKPADALLAT